MTTPTMPSRLVLAGLVLTGLTACSGESTPTAVFATPSFAVGDTPANTTPEFGKIKLCKAGNTAGSFTATRTAVGASAGTVLAAVTLQPGQCTVIAEDASGTGVGSNVIITETPSANLTGITAKRIDAPNGTISDVLSPLNGATYFLNSFHGFTITYTNTVVIPPPPEEEVCDFITFGRLVTEVNGKKVVISGNAGGNQPGGGILAEFHIDANGVDNHVANVDSYGPITSGVFFGLTNSRITTGTAKNGVQVELRLWDGGEPGKGTDRVYVKLNGVELLGPNGQYIDQGNMQYHNNCRGPK